jgi:F420-dependent oxidoreductase-like protein
LLRDINVRLTATLPGYVAKSSGRVDRMELRVFTEPQQGASYDDLLRVARTTEELGFGAFFRSDHFMSFGTEGLPGPTDSWVTLGALARETTRIRLGTLVTSVTFRQPGMLAIQVAQVDQMSGGRVELGIGAGWFGREHAAYGVPFPGTAERFDMLEEQLAVITGLWATDGGFDFSGEHYSITDSPGLPKPHQAKPPIIMGGSGRKRSATLAARYADEYNVAFESFEDGLPVLERVKRACEEAGRDPASLITSSALVLCVGKDEAEFERRAGNIGQDPATLRKSQLGGTVEEVLDKIGRYQESGQSRLYLQTLDLQDMDHLHLVADEIKPHV